MTDEKHSAFSTVGFEYAKRYKELTVAREVFLRERRTILIALAEIVRASLDQFGLTYSEEFEKKRAGVPKDDLGGWTWSIDRSYAGAWNGGRKKAERKDKRSGIQVWLSDALDDMPFGLYAFLWFIDDKDELFGDEDVNEAGNILNDHTVSKELKKYGVVSPDSSWIALPRFEILASHVEVTSVTGEKDLSVDALAATVSKLAALFARTDDLLAKYYEARTSKPA